MRSIDLARPDTALPLAPWQLRQLASLLLTLVTARSAGALTREDRVCIPVEMTHARLP